MKKKKEVIEKETQEQKEARWKKNLKMARSFAKQAGVKKEKKVETAADNAVAQIVENEAVQEDDLELIAVIAAAIAASEGAASADGYVVRSIRRIR